jgi:TolB-like protein/Flp pilus assembly protein TadD
MSPEQVKGVKADERSDIFSLGCILFELLNGRRPFYRTTAWETAAAIARESPEEITESAARGPQELQKIVYHCLEKNPDERFQSARDLAFALKSALDNSTGSSNRTQPLLRGRIMRISPVILWAAILMLAIAGAVSYWALFLHETIRSLAILPLVNNNADPNLDYISDGISESITNNLAQIATLRVMARSTVFHYRGRVDPRQAGRELKVDAVLTGGVVRDGDRLTINVELVRVKDGTSLWGERYTRSMSEILDLQELVSRKIVNQLRLKLTGEQERRLAKHYTDNPAAYHLYLKGRYFANKRNPDGMRKGMDFFQQALDQDPVYALAYAGIADAYALLGDYALLAPTDAYARARVAAQRALEIDEELPEAHTSLGHIYLNLWKFAEADQEYRRALQLNPNYAMAHQWYSNYLMAVGRKDEALEHIRDAVDLDPLTLITNSVYGWQLYLARRFDEAENQLHKTLDSDPNFAPAHATLGEVYVQEKKYPDAISSFDKAIELSGGNTDYRAMLGHVYAVSGDASRAQAILQDLEKTAGSAYVSPVYKALICTGLGQTQEALQFLRQAYAERSEFLLFIAVYPPFDPLQNNSEFRQILTQIGLQGH